MSAQSGAFFGADAPWHGIAAVELSAAIRGHPVDSTRAAPSEKPEGQENAGAANPAAKTAATMTLHMEFISVQL